MTDDSKRHLSGESPITTQRWSTRRPGAVTSPWETAASCGPREIWTTPRTASAQGPPGTTGVLPLGSPRVRSAGASQGRGATLSTARTSPARVDHPGHRGTQENGRGRGATTRGRGTNPANCPGTYGRPDQFPVEGDAGPGGAATDDTTTTTAKRRRGEQIGSTQHRRRRDNGFDLGDPGVRMTSFQSGQRWCTTSPRTARRELDRT